MIREILSTKGAFMPINEMKACHNIYTEWTITEPMVGFIMRSLTQTCAMPLTVVASRNMSPKATLTLPLLSSMAISWARSVGLQLSPDQIANSLEFSFLSSDEKFSDNKLVSNIFLSLSYRVTYKSYSVQTELMIIMPTKPTLTLYRAQ